MNHNCDITGSYHVFARDCSTAVSPNVGVCGVDQRLPTLQLPLR
jgi:hypothetical protein